MYCFDFEVRDVFFLRAVGFSLAWSSFLETYWKMKIKCNASFDLKLLICFSSIPENSFEQKIIMKASAVGVLNFWGLQILFGIIWIITH